MEGPPTLHTQPIEEGIGLDSTVVLRDEEEEEEAEEEGDLGVEEEEEEEEASHLHLPSRTPINQVSQLPGWDLQVASQVQDIFVDNLKEEKGEYLNEVLPPVKQNGQSTVLSPENAGVTNERPFWLTSDFLSDLPLDPKGEFHGNFEVIQLQNETTYPPLPSYENDILMEARDVSTNVHACNITINPSSSRIVWKGPTPAPVKKVRPQSASRPPPSQGPEKFYQKKVRDKKLYKRPYEPVSTHIPPPIQMSKKRVPVPSPKSEKKLTFSQLTSIPILNHESQLTSKQQRLCDLLTEDCDTDDTETGNPWEEEGPIWTQPPLYSLHTNRKSKKQKYKFVPPLKKSIFTHFRESKIEPANQADTDSVCVTEQPIGPADDIWTYSRLSTENKASSSTVIPTLWDSGNMSYSVLSFRVYSFLYEDNVPPLLPYNNRVKGVGGQPIKCFGITISPLWIKVSGLQKSFPIHCLVIDTPALHLNISLRSLKDNNITINFYKNSNSTITFRDQNCTIRSQKRCELTLNDFVTAQEACNLNELYSQHIKDAPEEILMEINQLGQFIPTQLKAGQTLSQINGHFCIYDNFVDAQVQSLQIGEVAPPISAKHENLIKHCQKRLNSRTKFKSDREQVLYPSKSYDIPARSQIYIACRSKFNLGVEYYAEANYYNFTAKGLAFPSHLGRCSSTNGVVHVPVVNLQNHSVRVGPLDPLIWAHAITPGAYEREGLYEITVCEAHDAQIGPFVWEPGIASSSHRPSEAHVKGQFAWEPGETNSMTDNLHTHDNTMTSREKRSVLINTS